MLKKLFLLASSCLTPLLLAGFGLGELQAQTRTPREIIASAIAAPTPDEQKEIILSLKASPSPEIIGWFEAVARHWNRSPTPFVWGGKRAARRRRQRERRHLGGSGACVSELPGRPPPDYGNPQSK